MEVNRKSCHFASLVVLIIFTTFPVKCLSGGDTYTPARERSENTQLKRYADYDSFVGLMGKRRAAPGLNIADHILADLLQQNTGAGCPSAQTFLQKRGFRYNSRGKQRRQYSL